MGALDKYTIQKLLVFCVELVMIVDTLITESTAVFLIIPSPLGTAATTGLLYQPQMIDEGDCGAICGMKIGRGNRSTRRKPTPAHLCPHDQTRARTRTAAWGSQRLTA
jgi:hypothetical protein